MSATRAIALQAARWVQLALMISFATALRAERHPEANGADASLVVQTTYGPVQGLSTEPGMRVFRSIPYAGPTSGIHRWRAPQPPAHWRAVRPAVRFGPKCPQRPVIASLVDDQPISEDCLNLNIWTPAKRAERRVPVMFWIHGGAYVAGSGASYFDWEDGATLARQGVVLVTINYRLGALGFFTHPELRQESADHSTGNYGLMDAIAALHWVQDNIARFGGDPNNVTIFGQSAGAEMVSILLASPQAKGLFRRGISESGESLSWREPRTVEAASEFGAQWSASLGRPHIADLRALPFEQLVAQGVPRFEPVWGTALYPVRLHDVLASGQPLNGAVMAGSDGDETPVNPHPTLAQWRAQGRAFYGDHAQGYYDIFPITDDESARQTAALEWTVLGDYAAALLAKGAARSTPGLASYQFRFNHAPPPPPVPKADIRPGAYHGAEVAYAFNALDTQPKRAWTAFDRQLARIMAGYWVNFARSGDPNGAGLPHWSSVQEDEDEVLVVNDAGVQMQPRPNTQRASQLEEFYYGSDGVWRNGREN